VLINNKTISTKRRRQLVEDGRFNISWLESNYSKVGMCLNKEKMGFELYLG